jgi:hypothetical protein
MKVFKVTITGVVTTDDDEAHPDYWSWSEKDMAHRLKDMGHSTTIVITEMEEVSTTVPLIKVL